MKICIESNYQSTMHLFVFLSLLLPIIKAVTVFTDEFSGPYDFTDASTATQLTSNTVTLDDYCNTAQCSIEFQFQIHDTTLYVIFISLSLQFTFDI